MTIEQLTDLAYTAGIVDGEGSISVSRQRPQTKEKKDFYYYRPRVHVVNTHAPTIENLAKKWGGSVYKNKSRSPKHKQTYSWVVVSQEAISFIVAIRPFLRMKAMQADIALEIGRLTRPRGKLHGQPFTWEELRVKNRLFQECVELNRRGIAC